MVHDRPQVIIRSRCGNPGRRICTLFSPYSSHTPISARRRGTPMKNKLAIAAVTLSLMSSAAIAGERPADAALGAVSGAVVFGPIGAVAGAVVGYTAGPSISHSWRRSSDARRVHRSTRQEARASAGDGEPVQRNEATPPAAAPGRPGITQGDDCGTTAGARLRVKGTAEATNCSAAMSDRRD
jgi:hypothetical protein